MFNVVVMATPSIIKNDKMVTEIEKIVLIFLVFSLCILDSKLSFGGFSSAFSDFAENKHDFIAKLSNQ